MDGDGEREFRPKDAQLALEAVETRDAERLTVEEFLGSGRLVARRRAGLLLCRSPGRVLYVEEI